MTFSVISFVENLLRFSPREGLREVDSARYIQSVLEQHALSFQLHEFETKIPSVLKAELVADGEQVFCQGSSFVSGIIKGKDNMISSMIDDRSLWTLSNINFNPRSDSISRSYYYWAPAVAISRQDVARVLAASDVHGEVQVEPFEYISRNILVGNSTDPEIIIFAHYDCIETGAIDNASGVAVIMKTLVDNPLLQQRVLFVFSGDEELSYDQPWYWGRGFREFEKTYHKQMAQARRVLVVDSLGHSAPQWSGDSELVTLAFPIENVTRWQAKITILHGDIDALMSVYHAASDDLSRLTEEFLLAAASRLHEELSFS